MIPAVLRKIIFPARNIMRPLSFTRNLGGFDKAYSAIKAGYTPGVSVKQFQLRCGLGPNVSHLVTEFLLGAQVHDGEEHVLADSLIAQTLSQPYGRLISRLYFFAINLSMPGDRLKEHQLNPAEMQNTLMREYLFARDGLRATRFDKDRIEAVVKGFDAFKSDDSQRKWVNNYSHMADQCEFVTTPGGRVETFADSWGPLALRLFFERYSAVRADPDANELISAAQSKELHKLIGVPKSWLDDRIVGAAEMFVSDEGYLLQGFDEGAPERTAAERGETPPPAAEGESMRRSTMTQQIIRRGENCRFLQTVYKGECQISGVRLLMPGGSFSVDCAHVRPLGFPHFGNDSTGNMLSLSPTMHRLFDRGCIRVDPDTFAIRLLHGNNMPHLPRLLLRGNHLIQKGNLSYHLSQIVK
jgi:hypothetical protein